MNKQITNKRITLITALGLLFLVLVTTAYVYNRKYNKQDIIKPSPEIPDTTGKEITNEPLTETEADNQLGFLIESAPIREENFSLIFSFKENKFKVTLTPSTKENYNKFILWLKDGGLDQIPPDRFIYTNYSP